MSEEIGTIINYQTKSAVDRFRVHIAVHGVREAVHTTGPATHPSEPGRKESWARTDRMAHAVPHLPGVAGRQWRTAYAAGGTHAARIHSHYANTYGGGMMELREALGQGGEAGDEGLMDVIGRRRIS
jgi:hypothetical protein